jgi:hypothetical protein
MFYSGRVKAAKDVAVVLRNDIVKRLTKVECYIDRLMFVKTSAKPVDIVLVQVYMPTTNHDDKIEKLYEEISEILHQEGRGQVNAIVMEDFNSIVGEGSTDKVVRFLNSVKEMREAKCTSTSASNIR